MPSFMTSSAAATSSKPADDYNCGWSAVHLLAAMSLDAPSTETPGPDSAQQRVVKLPVKGSSRNLATTQ